GQAEREPPMRAAALHGRREDEAPEEEQDQGVAVGLGHLLMIEHPGEGEDHEGHQGRRRDGHRLEDPPGGAERGDRRGPAGWPGEPTEGATDAHEEGTRRAQGDARCLTHESLYRGCAGSRRPPIAGCRRCEGRRLDLSLTCMPTIEFDGAGLGGDTLVEVPEGADLLDICDRVLAAVAFSCRSAACGTCHIEVVSGGEYLEEPNGEELLSFMMILVGGGFETTIH